MFILDLNGYKKIKWICKEKNIFSFLLQNEIEHLFENIDNSQEIITRLSEKNLVLLKKILESL
jgi:hypothetical protein